MNSSNSEDDKKISPQRPTTSETNATAGEGVSDFADGSNAQQAAAGNGSIEQQHHDEDKNVLDTSTMDKDGNRYIDKSIPSAVSSRERVGMPGAVAVDGTRSTAEFSTTNHTEVREEECKAEMGAACSVAPSSIVTTNRTRIARDQVGQNDADLSTGDVGPTTSEETPTSTPMIEAELVTPPVHAYHVHQVHIDEERDHSVTPLEIEFSSLGTDEMEKKNQRQRRYRVTAVVVTVFVAIAVIVAATVPNFRDANDEGATSSEISTTYPYPCFTSTYDLLIAQLDHDPQASDSNPYIICPGTRIPIGTFQNPAKQEYNFVGGDYPLVIIRENVTIQCGLDGSRDNGCFLDGGFIQMLLDGRIPSRNGTIIHFSPTIDNMVIRGVTFTGQMRDSGSFLSNSITMGHPGTNIRFEDCEWSSLTVNHGLIALYRNLFQISAGLPLDDQSMDVTFDGCSFRNITYDAALFYSESHNITLTDCTFENLELSSLHRTTCQIYHPDGDWVYDFKEGCAGLMYCSVGAYCQVHDVCVEDTEWVGMSFLFGTNRTTFEVDQAYWDYLEVNKSNRCDLAIASGDDLTEYRCVEVFSQTQPYPPSCSRIMN